MRGEAWPQRRGWSSLSPEMLVTDHPLMPVLVRNHSAVIRRWMERHIRWLWRVRAARTVARTAVIEEELMAATWAPRRLPQTGEEIFTVSDAGQA